MWSSAQSPSMFFLFRVIFFYHNGYKDWLFEITVAFQSVWTGLAILLWLLASTRRFYTTPFCKTQDIDVHENPVSDIFKISCLDNCLTCLTTPQLQSQICNPPPTCICRILRILLLGSGGLTCDHICTLTGLVWTLFWTWALGGVQFWLLNHLECGLFFVFNCGP